MEKNITVKKTQALFKGYGFKLKQGQDIYTKVNKVSKSGMSRVISVYIVDKERRIRDISRIVAEVLELKDTSDGVKVSGCGMDMSFKLVDDLACSYFGTGYKLNKVNL